MKRGTLIGLAVFAFSLLPAWAVKSASQESRLVWVGAILFFAFGGAMVSLASQAQRPKSGPYISRYRPPFHAVLGLSFLAAELLAIAFTYAEPGVGIVGGLGLYLAKLGAILFPVVAKYATAIEPPLSPGALFRAQAIVSVIMLAGVPSFIAYSAFLFGMPDTERRDLYASNPRKRPSDTFVILGVPFVLLIAATVFFGWFEFDDEPVTKAKECIMKAVCYARGDDLLVIAAAFIKTFAAFGAPIGALVVLDTNRVLPRT
ncbi:hypothetical protein [Allomesorhizobium camelthorni]|uniref:Uncharacterized protein n=1 Tax=Allomesorhizobium camelthorni TaxID=475069 RepID=A0A6G4WK17_9HYPH|nr:hypothetical protein [Mesorhizobium camelthorni]NGO54949.1 hypothetical protein [Mesorhizobium camelthorni]